MAIEQADESPDDVAMRHFFATLYQRHPYAHSVKGNKNTVAALTRKRYTSLSIDGTMWLIMLS